MRGHWLLFYDSKTRSGDYHETINFEQWLKWFKGLCLLCVVLRDLYNVIIVFVLDNARYHLCLADGWKTKSEMSAMRKDDLFKYIQERATIDPKLAFPEMIATKVALVQWLQRRYNPPRAVEKVIAEHAGFEVLNCNVCLFIAHSTYSSHFNRSFSCHPTPLS